MRRYLLDLEHAVSGLKNFLGEEEILALVLAALLLLNEKQTRYREERLPLEALKRDIRRLPGVSFASEEAARCAEELFYNRKISGLSDRILDHNLTESLLWGLFESTQTEAVPALAEETVSRLSHVLSFLRQRLLPPALTELMPALCGPLPEGAGIWDPYCGVGALLSRAAGVLNASGFGMEPNRLAAGFARVYYYLLTGRALELQDADQALREYGKGGYDAAVSVIPAGPYTAEEACLWERLPFQPTPRYGEAARIISVCDRLKEGGSAVLLVPNGVLFREGNDFELRKMLIGNGWLDAVIYLPARVLYHTTVPSSILIIRKGACREGLRLLHLEENPGWLQSGRQNRLTDRAVREIPAILREEAPSVAGLRMIPSAEYDPANYRLDPQFYFGGRPAPPAGEKTREELQRELEQAERAYSRAREELTALIRTVLP